MASPLFVERFIFFNKIDYELSKFSNDIGKKAECVKDKKKKSVNISSFNHVFLNLTDTQIANGYLLKAMNKLCKEKKIDIISYRYHPRFKDKNVKYAFSKLTKKSVEVPFYRNQHEEDLMKKCEYIITAVSSAITASEDYSGTIFLSRRASSFLNESQFDFFFNTLKNNIKAKVIEVT